MNNPKCLICISYSEIWILNWFFWLNDGKIDWIGCRLQQNENSSAFWRWNIFRFPFCSDIINYGFLVMFFCLENGTLLFWNYHRVENFHRMDEFHTEDTICMLVMNAEKTFSKRSTREKKLWNSTKVFTAMRKHSLQNNFFVTTLSELFGTFGTIFWTDHTELDFGLIHGHAHSPSISFSLVVISLIIQLFISRHSVSE